ncbi:MBL fold metallo-hydrolase [Rugamonas sp.]|uniref:MBL fold metallo-hydrolase n=1 Tax=Rugamonas sp. TaxID=1926287 RepID=UPI0025D3FFEF|nr:MBL fold metallo-hydrolase [Rugamonas sp.]
MKNNPVYPRRRALALACLAMAVAMPVAAQTQTLGPAPLPPGVAAAPPAPLSVAVLGSGGPGATGRAASSYLVLLDGVPRILVDAGPGSFVRLGEAGLSLARTDIVLLTHLHIDHVGELPGLFKARAVAGGGPIKFRVFGPDGRRGGGGAAAYPSTSRLMHLLFDQQGAFGYLRDFSAPLSWQVTDIASAVKPGLLPRVALSEGGLKITAIAGHHRDAPSVIYRIDYAGKSVTFSGDLDAEALADLRAIAGGTDLLVFNSVVLDPPRSPPVLYTLHTPPKTIGELARDAGVGRLLLGHLSPAVEQARDEVVRSIAQGYGGTVTFATDGALLVP